MRAIDYHVLLTAMQRGHVKRDVGRARFGAVALDPRVDARDLLEAGRLGSMYLAYRSSHVPLNDAGA